MNYKKIKMYMENLENRFYRDFLVREDVNLIELGCVMSTLIKATYEHPFYFISSTNKYVPEGFIGDDIDDELYMSDYKLDDLGKDFIFIYDVEEEWVFKCLVYDDVVKKDGNDYVEVIDGKGIGIFEDARITFEAYIRGHFDRADTVEELAKLDFPVPSNLDMFRYTEFEYYNPNEENETIAKEVAIDIYDYICEEHASGFEKDIKNIDLEDYLSEEEIKDFFGDVKETLDIEFENFSKTMELTLLSSVNEQIDTIDFVNKAYKRLSEKYSDFDAKLKIMEKLAMAVADTLKGSNEEYKKMVENLE